MRTWVPTTILLGYFGLVTLAVVVALFGEPSRSRAARGVLRIMLPVGFLAAAAEAIMVMMSSTN